MREASSPPPQAANQAATQQPAGQPLTVPGPGTAAPQAGAPILVTGAAGFIGAAVTRELVRAGQTVLGLDDLSAGYAGRLEGLDGPGRFHLEVGDVRDASVLDRLLGERPALVLHLAARVGVRTVLDDPEGCELENLDGARSLRDALERASASFGAAPGGRRPRVIAASTSEVYAEAKTPLREDSPLRPRAAEGRWRYAASKRLAEEILDETSGAGGAAHLRFFNVVGPGQDASSGMVLPRFVEAARAGEPIEVYGTGRQVRTFAHVDAVAKDVAALVLRSIAEPEVAVGPLNVGGTAKATISELATLVARTYAECVPLGKPVSIVQRDPRRAVSMNFEEVFTRTPDLSRLRSLGLGDRPWGLDQIVKDAVMHHVSPGGLESPRPAGASRSQADKELCASRAS